MTVTGGKEAILFKAGQELHDAFDVYLLPTKAYLIFSMA
jgi:hypothetical protein